ncbi:MAG: sigma-70 family RNA polymerase sigma factor, partial [Lentisphaerae bacterium]|nr:sigma-70 family RNA polymerase sigma factor [Lentisphaerota bacterium]
TRIQQHRHEFYRFVLRTVWDSAVAEDVFADAILTAYQNKERFTEGTNFRAWMFRILANKCFVANRETARRPESFDEKESDWSALSAEPGYADALADPDAFLEQCGDELYLAFRRLSTAERSCILLRAEKFSYQEMADLLEIHLGTVMTHLARGRTKLRRDLLEYARERGIIRPALRLTRNAQGHGMERKETAAS